MSDNLPVMRSRQAMAVERRTPQGPSDALIEKAKMIAAAGTEVLPKHYAGKQGACLLAVEWAERHDVSIFEAIAEVAFVHGKPVIQATMQKKLAAQAGYTTRKIEGDEKSCTVAVYGPDGLEVGGEGNGRFKYTMELAESLGLVSKNKLYKQDPAQMLYKRATTRALEHYGPQGLATVFHEVDDTEAEVVPLQAAPEPPTDEAALSVGDPPPVVDGKAAPPTKDELVAAGEEKGVRQPTLLKMAREMYPEDGFTDLDAVAANRDAALDLGDWIDQQ